MAASTPLMEQYHRIKRQHQKHVLFFRMGDFYEMFGEDAKLASRVLGIALTTRDKGKKEPIPLAGVPWHAAESYIARLIRAGHSVAICEQVEDPKTARGLVKREVVRVVTPGTALSPDLLDTGSNHFLAAMARTRDLYGMSYLDLSTGEFYVTEGPREEVLSDLRTIEPSELVIPESWREDGSLASIAELLPGITLTEREDFRFVHQAAYDALTAQFGTQSLDAYGCDSMDSGLSAAGAILNFLDEMQGGVPEHIDRIVVISRDNFLVVDDNAQRLLELVPSRQAAGEQTTLFQVLNHTRTAMGSRLLRQWIRKPLVSAGAIRVRQDTVEFLFHKHQLRVQIRKALGEVSDVERLVGRLACERVNGRDLVYLKGSLAAAAALRAEALPDAEPPLTGLLERIGDLPEIVTQLEEALVPDPPTTLKDGGLIQDGYHPELDALRETVSEGKVWIAALQQQERKRTGIPTLRVGYNRVFGYYLEVTKTHLKSVPPEYTRRQTLVGAERFITPELKEKESKILAAESRVGEMEYELFRQIREMVAAHREQIQQTARALAELDVFQSLSTAALENRYTRPEVHESGDLSIREGRHPMVEHFLAHQAFVPNDVAMDTRDRQILIITGPNMAGKSTYLRQVALIVILAQMGSFVPATEASVGIVDRIFTRIGAGESLARGRSTFLVEMTEVAHILHHATERSLLLLDEVGRGTSTYDGISIAWAVVEHLHGHGPGGAKTLFATHYHELTELAKEWPRVRNLNVAVREWNDDIVFLRQVVEGGADRSYGIHAARVAGLPSEVLHRAREILVDLESKRSNLAHPEEHAREESQMDLFGLHTPPHLEQLESELNALNPENLTPVEALLRIQHFKELVERDESKDSGTP
ncbi:MAG: DNA mismatch repair protein MutS [Candidatus Eisenbacteria sp.]|nr:DNA mismatch repair protein MutS [Candidatus Eisenbacteria bacterium]